MDDPNDQWSNASPPEPAGEGDGQYAATVLDNPAHVPGASDVPSLKAPEISSHPGAEPAAPRGARARPSGALPQSPKSDVPLFVGLAVVITLVVGLSVTLILVFTQS